MQAALIKRKHFLTVSTQYYNYWYNYFARKKKKKN